MERVEKNMKRKITVLTLCAALFALYLPAQAQQPIKIPRIGYLASTRSALPEEFRQGLRDLGYLEGKNIAFEFRASGGKSERNAELAIEFVRLKVDVIVAEGAGAIRAAKNATSTIPILMSEVNDPIALGFVASLAHPGGNITGLSNLSPELSGKRLELLKEVIPKLSRVALLAFRGVAMRTSIEETQLAARSLQLQLQLLEVDGPGEFESVFEAAKKQRAEAHADSPVLSRINSGSLNSAKIDRVALYNNRVDVEAGGLMSYGFTLVERQSALPRY
jgi:putative ABC transport system substrate-binding protein